MLAAVSRLPFSSNALASTRPLFFPPVPERSSIFRRHFALSSSRLESTVYFSAASCPKDERVFQKFMYCIAADYALPRPKFVAIPHLMPTLSSSFCTQAMPTSCTSF